VIQASCKLSIRDTLKLNFTRVSVLSEPEVGLPVIIIHHSASVRSTSCINHNGRRTVRHR
jgi:hypothetical protein